MSGATIGRRMARSCSCSTRRNTKMSGSFLLRAAIAPHSKRPSPPTRILRILRGPKKRKDLALQGRSLLRPCRRDFHQLRVTSHESLLLVTAWPRQGIDERAGARRVVPHLKRGVKVENETGSEAAAGAIDWKDRVAVDFVEVNVLQHGASPVREVEEVHAGLVGVDAGLDRDAAHGFAAAEEQVQIVAASTAAFLDDLRNGDAEVFPCVLLLDRHVSNELAQVIDAESFADLVDGEAHVARGERGVAGVDARRGELHGIRRAIEVEPGAGSRVVLMILDAEERDGARAAESVVHDDVAVGEAAGIDVDRSEE